jgi:hypothetical protein
MSNVRGHGQSSGKGYQSRSQIEKTHSQDKARDDLGGAFAGEENVAAGKGTHLKSRKLGSDAKDKVPKR